MSRKNSADTSFNNPRDCPPCEAFPLNEAARKQTDAYIDMLLAWNKAINLVGSASRSQILNDLVSDSFYLASFLENLFPGDWNGRLWDFGAGAGLPGIPLRIVWQKGSYTMIEAREKRALFLANVLSKLNLPDTHVYRGTVRKFLETSRQGAANCILARAFMPWQKFLALCEGLLAPDGKVIVMANEPASSAPVGWILAGQRAYQAQDRLRYFQAFSTATR